MASAPVVHRYALEKLYSDQDPDWVIDAMPAVVAWFGADSGTPGVTFEVEHAPSPSSKSVHVTLEVGWNMTALEARSPGVASLARRMRVGRTVQREHVVELAGYGLALVAISKLMPGRRVTHMERYRAPDLLFDATPGALRGVEVAARTSGGWGAIHSMSAEKRDALRSRDDIAELHLSLWCKAPRVGALTGVPT